MSTQPGSGPLATLPAELFSLLEGASIMHLGTRDAALQPMSVLAFGLQIARPPTTGEVTVFLPARLSEPTMTNLRDNGQMALTLVYPQDHRSAQIKGLWLGERRTDEGDRVYLSRYRDELTIALGHVGVPRSIWRRLRWWPCLALRMEVREAFVQTPGPSAGRRCDPAGPRP
jgi:hypothetical protein